MKLYIINENRRGSEYGIGTYIHELTASLRHTHIDIHVVNLFSDRQIILMEEMNGIKYWHFPAPTTTPHLTNNQRQVELYFRNVTYLLQLYIKDKKNLIFHLNHNKKGRFAEELKRVFDCRIVLTIHYLDWCVKTSSNFFRFRQLLDTQKTVQDDNIEESKMALQEEKDIFKVADHIICLSKKTQQILQNEYKIKPGSHLNFFLFSIFLSNITVKAI